MEGEDFKKGEKVFVFEKPHCFESVIVGIREDISGAYYLPVGSNGEKRLFLKHHLYKTKEALICALEDEADYLLRKIKEIKEAL
jgi:hypothetical protein